jgi:predicted ATPase
MLRDRGYQVVDEQATQIIKEGKFLPWVDRIAFQQEVLRRQIAVETRHEGSVKPVFLDRGLFDGAAYYIADGLPVPQVFAEHKADRYSLALLIEELPFFDNNGVRFEDIEFTRRFTPIVESCYVERGVPVQRIPALEPTERVDFVLKVVQQKLAERGRPPIAVPAGAGALNLAFA